MTYPSAPIHDALMGFRLIAKHAPFGPYPEDQRQWRRCRGSETMSEAENMGPYHPLG